MGRGGGTGFYISQRGALTLSLPSPAPTCTALWGPSGGQRSPTAHISQLWQPGEGEASRQRTALPLCTVVKQSSPWKNGRGLSASACAGEVCCSSQHREAVRERVSTFQQAPDTLRGTGVWKALESRVEPRGCSDRGGTSVQVEKARCPAWLWERLRPGRADGALRGRGAWHGVPGTECHVEEGAVGAKPVSEELQNPPSSEEVFCA